MRYVNAPYGALLSDARTLESALTFSPSPRLNATKLWLEAPEGEPLADTLSKLRMAGVKLSQAQCVIPGCTKSPARAGRCANHPLFPMRRRDCEFPGCDRPATSRGMCASHYAQSRRESPLTPLRTRGEPYTAVKITLPDATIDKLGPDVAAKIVEIITEYLTPQKGSATPLAPYRSKG